MYTQQIQMQFNNTGFFMQMAPQQESSNIEMFNTMIQMGNPQEDQFSGYMIPAEMVYQESCYGSFGSLSSMSSQGYFSDEVPSQDIETPTPFEIQQLLQSWTLTDEQREFAGFPRFDQCGNLQIEPTIWERGSRVWIDEAELSRRCSRCYENFEISEDGRFPVGKGICQFKVKGRWTIANSHVTNQRFASELGKFMETPAAFGMEDIRNEQIYALDAEMVLTTAGPALARISLVDFDGHLAMDIVVKPDAQVVNCLTQYSGITMDMLEEATHTLESARNCLFQFINSDTILIGHGLDSDLKALRLVHRNVIDTSILFQDEGKNKVALRTLAKTYLNRTIQADNSSTFGHCSEEDAVASLDLVKYMINYVNI